MFARYLRLTATCLGMMAGTLAIAALPPAIGEIGAFQVGPGTVFGASVAPDGSRFVTGCRDGKSRVWDIAGSKSVPLNDFDDYGDGMLFAVAFSPDSGSVIFAGDAPTTKKMAVVRQVGTALRDTDWVLTDAPVGIAVESAPSQRIAVADAKRVSIRDLSKKDTKAFADRPGLKAIAWRDNLIASGDGQGIALWNPTAAAKSVPLSTVETSTPIRGLAFAPAPNVLFASGDDGTIRVVDASAQPPTKRDAGMAISTAAASADGSVLAAGGIGTVTGGAMGQVIAIWDGTTVTPFTPTGQSGDVKAMGLSADGKVVAWGIAGKAFGIKVDTTPPVVTTALTEEVAAIAPIAGATIALSQVVIGYQTAPMEIRKADGTGTPQKLAAIGVNALALDPSNTLYSGHQSGDVLSWNLSAATPMSTPLKGLGATNSPVRSLSVVGGLVAAGTDDGQVVVWEPTKSTTVPKVRFPQGGVRVSSLALASDGTFLVTASDGEGFVRVWDLKTLLERQRLAHTAPVVKAVAARIGQGASVPLALAAGSSGKELWALPIAVKSAFVAEANASIGALVADDVAVYAGLSSGHVNVYGSDGATMPPVGVEGSKEVIALATTAPAAAPQLFALCKDDKSLRRRAVAGGQLAVVVDGLPDVPTSLAAIGGGRFIALGFAARPTVVIDLQSAAKPKESLTLFASPPGGLLAPMPDDRLVATSATKAGLWRVLGPGAGAAFLTPINGAGRVFAAAWLGDQTKVVLGGDHDPRLRLWDLATMTVTDAQPAGFPSASVFAVATSTDGNWIASGGGDKVVSIWEKHLSKTAASTVLGDRVNTVAFQPGSLVLASGTADNSVQLWQFNPGGPSIVLSAALAGHTSAVKSVSFNPKDPTKLASLGLDGVVIVWDVSTPATPSKVATLAPPPTYQGQQVSWSSDGTTLIVAGSDGQAHRLAFTP